MESNLTTTFICNAALPSMMEHGGGVVADLTRPTDDDYDEVNQRMGLPDDIAEGVVSMAFQATETMTDLLVSAAEYNGVHGIERPPACNQLDASPSCREANPKHARAQSQDEASPMSQSRQRNLRVGQAAPIGDRTARLQWGSGETDMPPLRKHPCLPVGYLRVGRPTPVRRYPATFEPSISAFAVSWRKR